jgi:uncharacterized membrane protein
MKKVLFFNIIIMLLYTKAVRWHIFLSLKRLIVVVCFYFIMLFLIPFIVLKSKNIAKYVDEKTNVFVYQLKYLFNNKMVVLKIVVSYLLLAGLGILITYLYSVLCNEKYNVIFFDFILAVLYIIYTVYLLRKQIHEKPERLFFSLLMIIGLLYISSMPNNVGISWDDEIHYQNVLSVANFADEVSYQCDTEMHDIYTSVALEHVGYSQTDREKYNANYNTSFNNRIITTYSSNFGVSSIAYIPYAAGILLGRALSLPFTWIFKLAKIINLIFYGLVISSAMKKLKFGKILVATIALFPTVVFMACNFAYDPWVISLSIFGFSYFFSFLQKRDKKLESKDIVVMLGAFILAFLPKAVYFVAMLPLFFLPKKTFKSDRQRRWYLVLVTCSGLLLVSSFILPIVLSGAGVGDVRGGTDVNSSQQILYIISNPLVYSKMILSFLYDYLGFMHIGEYAQNMTYITTGRMYAFTTIVVCIVCLLDKNGNKSKNKLLCITSYIGAFLAMLLVATALYVSINPVGSETIGWCQYRYIIPVLFPVLYMVAPDLVVNNIDKKYFNSLPMLFMAVTFIVNGILTIVPLY